jgi:epoxide hydrolase-like predicted phosphatase
MTSNWNQREIKAVIFDHGGVLTRGGGKGTNERAASLAMGLDDPIEVLDLNLALKTGKIDNSTFVDQVNRRYPDAPRVLTDDFWNDIYQELTRDKDAYRFAGQCHAKGYKVGILSSISEGMARRLWADGSYNGFEPVVLSCDEGYAKPDPRSYDAVEEALPGIRNDEILFLDDQERCCVGARDRGWRAIRVDTTEQMIHDVSIMLGLA